MKRAMVGWRLVATFCVLHLVSAHAAAQTSAGGLPEGWSELPLSEFVARAQQVFPPKDPAAEELANAVRAHAAQRLLGLQAGTTAQYEDLFTLYRWARPNLTAEQQQQVLSSVGQQAPLANVPNWTLERVHAVYRLMGQFHIEDSRRAPLLLEWLRTHDRAALDKELEGTGFPRLLMLKAVATGAQKSLPQGDQRLEDLLDAIRAQAAGRLLAAPTGADADYKQLMAMYDTGRDKLTMAQRQEALRRLGSSDQVRTWPLAQVQRMRARMRAAEAEEAALDTSTREWLVEWMGSHDRAAVDQQLGSMEFKDLQAFKSGVMRAQQAVSQPDQRLGELLDAIRGQAAGRLLGAPIGADADYKQLMAMYDMGRDKLTLAQRQEALRRLGSSDQAKTSPLAEVHRVWVRMRMAQAPEADLETLLRDWLENASIDASAISDPAALFWICDQGRRLGIRSTDFSVRWTGLVKAPVSGQYVFSIPAIEEKDRTTRVWVGDRQVLDSTNVAQGFKSGPVALEAGKETPLRVEFSYASSQRQKRILGIRRPVVMLMWEGPGVTRSLVPASALLPPAGGGEGLQAEYRLLLDGREETVVRTEPVIAHVWKQNDAIVPDYADTLSRLVDRLWALVSDPEYLDKWEEALAAGKSLGSGKSAVVKPGDYRLADLFGLAQQAALASELLARPALLDSASMPVSLYLACRVAAPEEALNLLGTWSRLHPDAEPGFSKEFFFDNRRLFDLGMEALGWQRQRNLALLEERFLVMPDGSCCLPVAYVLAYAYAVEARNLEWIEKLDSRLADEAIAGDRRVNWLLARAQAEEMYRSPQGRGTGRFLAGRAWLETACLVGQSEGVRLRAYKELAVRLAAESQLEGAKQLLARAGERISEPSSAARLAAWRQEIDQLATGFEEQRQQQAAQAKEAYVRHLRERYQGAVDSGNEKAISRYEQLLTAAGAKPE